jgi:hypothetical protein
MWELIFMMLVLKIPIVYLCSVVWWAIKAEPEGDSPGGSDGIEWKPWQHRPGPRPRRGGPHGSRPRPRPAMRSRRARVDA